MSDPASADDPLDPGATNPGVHDAGEPAVEEPSSDTDPEQGSELDSAIDVIPGLARITVGAWVRTAAWGAGSVLDASRRLTDAARSGESATEFIEEVRDELVRTTRRVLGVEADGAPVTPPRESGVTRAEARHAGAEESRRRSLRDRGAALLERSADVDTAAYDVHPGFDRIVDQLSPDEARVLRLLHREGPQGIIYVNRAGPLGFGAREIARRISLIGREAGCVHRELVAAYLDNLVRLGLVAIRRDPVGGEGLYQVIEAQPEAVAAMKKAGGGLFRGQTTRRGVHLTDFGRGFCEVCLPVEPD